MDQRTEAATMPAAPIRMYVVEEVMPNGDVEIEGVYEHLGMAQDMVRRANKWRDDKNEGGGRLFLRHALLHYDRPRMDYGEVRLGSSIVHHAEQAAEFYPPERDSS